MTDPTGTRRPDHGPRYRDPAEMEWETLRFPGQTSKMVFHPSAEEPTVPNTGLVRYEPGAFHPRHRHDFAQVWYILEGTFRIGARECGPGTMIFHPDPHFEDEFQTATGGEILIVQYPGPTTGGRPIYDERFNLAQRRPVSSERIDQ